MTTFETQRQIPATPAAVFAAISDAQRLAKWWGPDGFTNTFETCDFTPGGMWRFTMHGPDGANYANESVFAEIEPDKRVVVDHTSPPHFRLLIELTESEGGTLVHWVQTFEDAGVAAAVRHIVEPANEQNLTRLTHEVASV
ncbi:MAG: SRPBCC domain-containing protein [Acidobacteriota bacterium]|nr:SRPBCC domain-containing protein [Acidobacteriota bacterium]